MSDGNHPILKSWYVSISAGVSTLLISGVPIGLLAMAVIWLFPLSCEPELRLSVPGTHEVVLAASGYYLIFHEYGEGDAGSACGASMTGDSIQVVLVDVETKVPVIVEQPWAGWRYSGDGRYGRGIAGVDVPKAGTYSVTLRSISTACDSTFITITRPYAMMKVLWVIVPAAALFVLTFSLTLRPLRKRVARALDA